MKKIFVLFCLSLSAIVFFSDGMGQAVNVTEPAQIYYVDRRLHRLIPVDYISKASTPKKIAREITENIIIGKSDNSEILQLIPQIENSIKVNVRKNTAFVDLSPELSEKIVKNPETERLIVYQLVNSLTSVDGINTVQFTIGSKTKRDFLGFLDMREIFTPDYDI